MKTTNVYLFVCRRGAMERTSSRLTSAVRPLVETAPSEAFIDIKPEMDDDLIADDPVEIGSNHGRTRGTAGRPTAEIYRAGHSKFSLVSSADTFRSSEGSSHSRQQDSRSSRSSRSSKVCDSEHSQPPSLRYFPFLFRKFPTGVRQRFIILLVVQQEELSRKRKAPVASSVVRVNRAADEDSDDDDDDVEEEEPSYGGRGMSSRVSLPSKPERRCDSQLYLVCTI